VKATNPFYNPHSNAHTSLQAPEWLLCDLNYILDYCIQEGEYDEADRIVVILEEAGVPNRTPECTPAAYAKSLAHME